MKNIIRYSCAVLIILVSACDTQAQSVVVESDIDLNTWQKIDDDPWFLVNNSVAAGPAEAVGFLVSNETYDDFTLSLEYWVEDNTNSGIFIRCNAPQNISAGNCYEINIWDNHPNQESRTGSIVMLMKPLIQIDTLERWVRVDIEAEGNRIRAMFDGQLTAELVNERSSSGVIALQYAGTGILKFRNLSIESNQ
jgi:hypothetical protein